MNQNKSRIRWLTIFKEIGVTLVMFLVSYYSKGLSRVASQADYSIRDIAAKVNARESFRRAFKVFYARLPWYQKMWFFLARFVAANLKFVVLVISVGFIVSLFIIFGVLPALLIYLVINADKVKF